MTTRSPLQPAKKRRLSSLTLVILVVNIIPLLIMAFGVFYLDQYKQNLIEVAYLNLEQEIELIELVLDGEPRNFDKIIPLWDEGASLFYLNHKGEILKNIGSFKGIGEARTEDGSRFLNFTEAFAELFVYLNPLRTSLPEFPWSEGDSIAEKFPEVNAALMGTEGLAAWSLKGSFVLTSAVPTRSNEGEPQVILLIKSGDEITNDINEVRRDIIKAFVIVIILTFLLSVYLSSFIAIPLKRLERAAEDIRRGKRDLNDFPDMSQRRDEIGELSIILRQMTEALNSRIDAIQTFAADVSHEIKNPITSLRSAIETAQNVNEKPKRDSLLKIMEQDVYRLDRLITDISKHSRLDSELARENFEIVDLKNLLEQTTVFWNSPLERERVARGADNQNTNLETIFPDTPCLVLGKAESLAQVFQNLIDNALSFNNTDMPVRLTLKQEEGKILIAIEDNGKGIPPSRLDKIFQRFYTDRPEDHDKRQNSGLGLAIAKQIIDAHKGKIYAENIIGNDEIKGARFTVILDEYTP